jgi:hypothetical protein
MSSLPLHPAIVHVPLGVALVLPLAAAVLTIAVWKGKLPRVALAVVTGLLLVLVAGGFTAMTFGDRDAKQAALVAPRDAIEEHEEAADLFVWVAVGILALSVVPLLAPARLAPRLGALVTVGTVVVAGLAVNVGEKGGDLVFQHGAGVQAARGALPAQPAGGAEPEEHEHGHD